MCITVIQSGTFCPTFTPAMENIELAFLPVRLVRRRYASPPTPDDFGLGQVVQCSTEVGEGERKTMTLLVDIRHCHELHTFALAAYGATPMKETRAGMPPYTKSYERRINAAYWQYGGLILYLIPVVLLLCLRLLIPANIADDAFISFRTAFNLAAGNGMVFNLGEPIYVVTTPLWAILLGGLHFLFQDVVATARILGTLFEVLLLLTLVNFSEHLTYGKRVGVIAAILLCTNPVFLLTSFSGMELPLYLFSIVLTMNLLAKKRFGLATAVAAVGLWIRFDGFILYMVSVAWSLYAQRDQLRSRPLEIFSKQLPAVLIVIGYFVFGYFVFHSVIPVSVQRKSLESSTFFSEEWFMGVWITIKAFLGAIVGKVVWFVSYTPLVIIIVPLIIGAFWFFRGKEKVLTPLVAFTLLYVLSFVASGSSYAQNFPWYFVPILPAAYLIAAIGILQLIDYLRRKFGNSPLVKRYGRFRFAGLLLMAIWIVAMVAVPIRRDVAHLTHSEFGQAEREQTYAAAAVWAGRNLDSGATIAANEIGAIGFFLPTDMSLLDMFGLLRNGQELQVDYIELIDQKQPELVLTKRNFSYKGRITNELNGRYGWYTFRTLDVGLRADLIPALAPRLEQLPEIYNEIDMDREYPWASNN